MSTLLEQSFQSRTGRREGNPKGVDETHLSITTNELKDNRDRRLKEIMKSVFSCTRIGLGWYYSYKEHWKGKIFAERCRQNITKLLPELTKAAWEFSNVMVEVQANCHFILTVFGYGEKLVDFFSYLRL